MFKEILASFKIKKKIKQITSSIKLINELIYSEKFDFNQSSDQEEFFEKISPTKDKIKLYQVYKIANRLTKSQSSMGFNEIIDLIKETETMELNSSSKSLEMTKLNLQLQEGYLKAEKLKIQLNLFIIQQHISNGKKAFKEDPYSFEGIIYRMEKAGKRAITLKEMIKVKELRDNMKTENDKLEEINLKQKELNDEIEEVNSN